LLEELAQIFGEGTLQSVATDKGYWSKKNRNEAIKMNINPVGMQKPTKTSEKLRLPTQKALRLRNRRAGVEPLIGHIKQGGMLGRSRMKTDSGTLAAGYTSVLGFNMGQKLFEKTYSPCKNPRLAGNYA
jgi:hypothetical protein